MRLQLVIQLPASSLQDYHDLIGLEDAIAAGLAHLGSVDGHDMGSGEANIFVPTDNPEGAFRRIEAVLGTKDFHRQMRVAFRERSSSSYTILHPPGLSEFSIA